MLILIMEVNLWRGYVEEELNQGENLTCTT